MASTGTLSADTPSRAMKIPHREGNTAYLSPARPRRSARQYALVNMPDPSETGASSFSSDNSSPTSSLLNSGAHCYPHPPSLGRRRLDDPLPPRYSDLPPFSSSPSFLSPDVTGPHTPSSKQDTKAVRTLDPPHKMPSLIAARGSPLGPSMLSSQTYTSINLNGLDPDEPPRLITFTKAGQGFNWNEELFLPSYMIHRYSRNRRKQYDGDLGEDDVEVAEIFVTDEEATNMMP